MQFYSNVLTMAQNTLATTKQRLCNHTTTTQHCGTTHIFFVKCKNQVNNGLDTMLWYRLNHSFRNMRAEMSQNQHCEDLTLADCISRTILKFSLRWSISLPLHPYHTHSALTARYMHNKLIPHAASLDSEMHIIRFMVERYHKITIKVDVCHFFC